MNNVPDDVRSFVCVAAPHTSNFDFIPVMAVIHLMKRKTRFIIKDDWVRFPLIGTILKWLGAIGLDREVLKSGHQNNTDSMADLYRDRELVLIISPEGTRSANSKWKTGFYYVAQKAEVPIVMGFIDYAKKEAGLGKVIYPTDFEKDMREIMDFYRAKLGRVPEKFRIDSRFG